MKKIGKQAGFFAILLAAVFAEGHVEAMTLELGLGEHPGGPSAGEPAGWTTPTELLALLASVDRSLLYGANAWETLSESDSASPAVSPQRAGLSADDLADIPADGSSPYVGHPIGDLSASAISGSWDIDDARPAGWGWVTPEGEVHTEAEDWLFRLQFSNFDEELAASRSHLFPVPEPASLLVLLAGLAGIAIKRKQFS